MNRATVFAPGSIGNVGPGFDILGLAVDNIGDIVTLELIDGQDTLIQVRGRDASLVPTNPAQNVVNIAAHAMLRLLGLDQAIAVSIEKGLPVAGGLGGSAASSVAGAYAAAIAVGVEPAPVLTIEAALAGIEVQIAVNLAPEEGQAGSVRAGIAALPASVDWAYVWERERAPAIAAASATLWCWRW